MHAKARSVRNGHKPRTVALGILSGLLSTILLGLWLSGTLDEAYSSSHRFASNRLLAAGFAVDHIEIDGVRQASEREVRNVIGIEKGELIFAIDLKDVRERVESLGWVHRASVTRLLPNRISVVITERTPYAVWQQDNQFSVVSSDGKFIQQIRPNAYSSLPLIVGNGAEIEAGKLLSRLAGTREFNGKIHSVIRVSQRRWNVHFSAGSKLYLPANNWDKTLKRIAKSENLMALLDLPFIVVDARISGQIAVRRQDPFVPPTTSSINS